jgi:hypothetical protein
MTPVAPSGTRQATSKSVWLPSIGILLLYVAALYLVSRRFIPWLDEVQYTDPGANLYFNGRFVSTTWPHQTSTEVFFGAAPLYSFLLGLWFKVVGFGVLQARALAWLFGVMGIGVAMWLVDQSQLVGKRYYPWLVALFLSSWGVNQSFWSARYDTLGLFLVSLVLAGAVQPESRRARYLSRFALVLVPLAGYHLVIVCLFILLFPALLARRPLRPVLVEGGWLAMGLAVLVGTYVILADPKRFLIETFFSANTLTGQITRGVVAGSSVLGPKIKSLLSVGYQDPSFTLLLAFVLVIWLCWPRARRRDRTDYILLAGAVLLPLTLSVIGHYRTYYSWIGHSCACVLALRLIERVEMLTTRRAATLLSLTLLVLAAAVGGLRWAISRTAQSATRSQIASINAAVRAAVRPGEYVYSDFGGYFSARPRARYVYTETYAQTKLLPGFPTEQPITTMIVQSRDQSTVAAFLGGEWHCGWKAPVPLAAGQDPLEICRRTGPASATVPSR